MLSRLGGIVAGIAIATCSFAGPELRLGFDAPGNREAWVALGPLVAPPTTKHPANERLVRIPFDKPQKGLQVWVHDIETGNVARKPVGLGSEPIPFKSADFTLIFAVRVRLEHSGRPVAAARIALDDGNGPRDELLVPEDRGEVRFYGVKPGNVKVEVEYKVEGRAKALPAQSFEVSLDREDSVPTLTLVVPDAVPTVPSETEKAAGRSGADRASPQAQPSTGTSVGRLLVYALALAAGIAAAYGLLRLLQGRSDRVAVGLKKLGVAIPEPETESPDASVPAPITAPTKPEPIILEGSEATPLAEPPTATSVSVVNRGPRLVSADGAVFAIPPGASVVGRETGLPISLPSADTVSRRHAELDLSGGQVTLRDLGSTNGTFVNGQRLTEARLLKPGDEIQFGAVRFRFEA